MAKTKLPAFKNETYKDYTQPAERRKMEQEIAKARAITGKKYPLIIGGEEIKTDDYIPSYNPAHPGEVIGLFSKGTVDLAQQALDAANSAWKTWSHTDYMKRVNILVKAAAIMRKRRYEINAWMVLEVGKNFAEADADTGEAIDFLEFYARDMVRLGGPQPVVPNAGEKGFLQYIPLGIGVIVPPWNFPFAILAGMSSAAIVAGNTIVLKPSSDSPMMGWLFADIMRQAGLPKGVLNFFTAPGGEVGDYLVNSPMTRFVSFTGSKEIGLRVTQNAATPQPGQKWIKRVVAEMGGKDGIVVLKDADLDAAADGIVASAFGFQGQKCSACSRAIIEQKVYPQMVEKIVARVNALEMGDPAHNMRVGPVVSSRAYKTISNYIEIGKQEGRVVAGGVIPEGEGYYIPPTVIADVKPDARISLEEIFGPVLALIPVKDLNEALEVANNTEYGLTGAFYSSNPKSIERAKKEFFVGNLYINRKCTGALVGVHPFGGFNMSGTDSKAGGHDYLLLFLQAMSVAEKTIKAKPAAKKPAAKKAVAKSMPSKPAAKAAAKKPVVKKAVAKKKA